MIAKSSIVLAAVLAVAMAEVCPPNACAGTDCGFFFGVKLECPDGRIDPKAGHCGCCPGCVKFIKEGESCAHLLLLGVPAKSECAPGLSCDSESKLCQKKLNPCHQLIADIEEAARNSFGELVGRPRPQCDADGFYAPMQCVEAVCKCVKADGTPIIGFEANVGHNKDMGCQCARDKAEKETSGLIGAKTRQCDGLGNYKARQCFEGSCSCVDRMGEPIEGFTAEVGQAAKMSCSCARRNDDIKNFGMNCLPHACDNLGNYIDRFVDSCGL